MFGTVFVCFKSKILLRGKESEAAVVIVSEYKQNQATSVSSEPFPRGVTSCEDFAMFYAVRRCPAGGVVENVKNK